MTTELTMPMLGEVMEEGLVRTWRKREGERVAQGEIVLEIENGKAVMEIEAPVAGTVIKILVPEGATVPIHTLLAIIDQQR